LSSLLKAMRGSPDNEISDLKRQIEELSRELREVKEATSALSERVDKLTKSLTELSREVSKLGDVVGFVVEDIARSFLPFWLSKYMNIKVETLNRVFFECDGKIIEVDLFGEGFDEKSGSRVLVIGEVKSRIHGNDVKAFHEKVAKLLEELKDPKTPVLVIFGLYTHPTAEIEARHRGVLVVTPYSTVQGIRRGDQCEIIQSISS